MPYAPDILSYVSDEWKSFKVQRSAATTGPPTSGFEMFHRLETTGPDGEWSFRGSDLSIGSCDFSPLWCYAWDKQAFHNYTVRIIGFNTEGFGLATDPYRVTTKEKSIYYNLICIYHFKVFTQSRVLISNYQTLSFIKRLFAIINDI